MPANESSSVLKLSLSDRIHQLEDDIDRRRDLINQHSVVLKHKLRHLLLSPVALLTYAGVGVGVGLLLGRRPAVSIDATSTHAAQNVRAQPGRIERLFADVFKLVAMVRTLASILPAAPTHSSYNSTATPREKSQ